MVSNNIWHLTDYTMQRVLVQEFDMLLSEGSTVWMQMSAGFLSWLVWVGRAAAPS